MRTLLSVLLLGLVLFAQETSASDPRRFPQGYYATPIQFQADVFFNRGADLTGAADSKLWTVSFWFKPISTGSIQFYTSNNPTGSSSVNATRVVIIGTNVIEITGRNTGDTANNLRIQTVAGAPTNAWSHIIFSVDMANAANRHMYLNDVSDLSVTTYTDAVIDFTRGDFYIGRRGDSNANNTGLIADMVMWYGVYVDLSVEANRRLFITANKKPVDLGIAVAKFGTPILRMDGISYSGWETNKGSGGGLTRSGGVSEGLSSPSD